MDFFTSPLDHPVNMDLTLEKLYSELKNDDFNNKYLLHLKRLLGIVVYQEEKKNMLNNFSIMLKIQILKRNDKCILSWIFKNEQVDVSHH